MENDYILVKDQEIAVLLMAHGVLNAGYVHIGGMMYLKFSKEFEEKIESLKARYLSNENMMVELHSILIAQNTWHANLHSYLDDKRNGKFN